MDLPTLIPRVQSELGALISKPVLTDVLLSKPPFRFLHDVISAVTAATGFAAGLYTETEMDARSIKEKAEKLAYLDKIVAAVAATGELTTDLRPSKVVAGAEPENTCAFLLALARAARRHASGGSAAAAAAPAAAPAPAARATDRVRSAARERIPSAPAVRPPAELGANGDIARTMELVQPLISKPRLTEKLLSKPPFRFLHDVFSAVMDATGFAVGLYTEAESNHENITEKEAKMAYLDKMIACLGIALHTQPSARSNKIVAGAEPEFTNELLQLLAIAASRGVSSADAVRAVLGGATQLTSGAPAPTPAPMPGPAAPSQASASATAVSAAEYSGAPATAPVRATSATAPRAAEAAGVAPAPSTAASEYTPVAQPAVGGEAGARLLRPKTAQRRPPKLKDNVVTPAPGAAGGAAGGVSVAVMREGSDDSDEEDADTGAAAEGKREEGGAFARGWSASGGGGAGKHSRDIMQQAGGVAGGASAEEGGIRFSTIRREGRGGSAKRDNAGFSGADMERLRDAVQRLCTHTNPLGKSMNYLTEDVEDMRAELRTWRSEYKKGGEVVERELKMSDEALEPLRRALSETDERCNDMRFKVTQLQATIAANDARVQELARLVVFK